MRALFVSKDCFLGWSSVSFPWKLDKRSRAGNIARVIRIRRAALVIVAVTLTAGGVFWLRPGPRAAGPLPQQAYVWQRAWTEPVRRSVSDHATNFTALVVLHAE